MSLPLELIDNLLSKNKPPILYFIMGSERFLIKESIKKFKEFFVSPELVDFNYELFCAEDGDISKVRTAVETLPVFSEKKVVVCESAEFLKDSDWKILKPLVENPIDTCILIFTCENVDKRKKIIKALVSRCECISSDPPKDKDWGFWIQWMGKREDLLFSNGAIALMKEYACYDLMNLETEVQKLKKFAGEQRLVSEKEVLAVVPRMKPENIFVFTESLAQKQLAKAFLKLSRLLEDNHNEVAVLALVSRHMRILARVKEGANKGCTESTLCKKTGVPVFFIRRYIQQAGLWTEKQLRTVIQLLQKTDKDLKTSSVSSHLLLEHFIIKTCSL